MLKLVVALVLAISFNVCAIEKPTLRFIALEMPGYTSADKTGVYWDILRALYGKQYHLKFAAASPAQLSHHLERGDVDGVIGTHLLNNSSWVTPQQHIDLRYALYLLSLDSKETKFDELIIAARKDAYLQSVAADKGSIYHIEKIENVLRLIEKQRVDAALTYSYNLHLSDPTGVLTETEVVPEKKVYITFNRQHITLAEDFEQDLAQLKASGQLKTVFGSDAQYSHANLNHQPAKQKVPWHIIPKRFDPETGRMNALQSEVLFSQQLESYFSDIDLHIKLNSMRSITNVLSNSSNACAFNIYSSASRKEYAIFSKPTYVFLKPRLLIKKDSKVVPIVNDLVEQGGIDLERLFVMHPQVRVAVAKNGHTYRILKKDLPQNLMEHIHVQEDKALSRTLQLLLTDRVDAIITWPNVFSLLINDEQTAKKITSFDVQNLTLQHNVSYVACSKSELGHKVIEQVNQVLTDTQRRTKLFEAEHAKLDGASVKEFKAVLDSFYQ